MPAICAWLLPSAFEEEQPTTPNTQRPPGGQEPSSPCVAVFVPDLVSRAIRWSTSASWELNHVDPGERTARKLLESAAHLEVAEIDGHESESIDELRDLVLRRHVVARDK
jgi:hypothetical protein